MVRNERTAHHRGAGVARTCSWLVITIAAVVVAGWYSDLPTLQSFIPGRIEMKLVTAMAFAIAAAALLAALTHPPRERLRTALAVVMSVLSLLSIGEYVTRKNLLFWMWDAHETGAAETLQAGRMAPNTAVSLLLIGLTLALLRARSRPARAAVNAALLVVSLLVLEVLIGYAYGASGFRGPAAFNPMALPTAICFILMVTGIASLRRHEWPLSLLSGDFPSVSAARLVLPGAVAIPFVVGWLALLGERARLYDFAHGVGFFAISQIVLIGSLIVWSTSRLRAAEVARQHSDARVRRTITVQERIVGAAASTDDAVSAIVAGATEIAGADGAAVALLRGSDLLILGASGIASGLAGQVLAAEEVLEHELLRMTGAESIVTFPLRCGTQTRCVLAVISERRDAFSDEDFALLQLIAPASSSALGHAGQFWRLSRQNELLLTHAAAGIFGLDRTGKVTFVNPAVSKISGWSREELLAAPSVHDMLHGRKPDGAAYPPGECPMNQTIADGIVRNGRELFFRKTGEPFPVELSCSPIYEESEITGCVAIFEDVSERLQLEQQVEQSRRINTLGHVAATIAHEFNNVLMGIQPFAEVIRQRAKGDETLTKAASQIITSVTRGKRVTQEILQFTQPDEPAVQVVDTEEWLGALLPELRAMIGHRIHLALEVPRERVMIRCDAPQLQQVLINLVLNARDAMPRGGKITITLSADRGRVPAGMALLSVADTGTGMTGKVLENIFEPLFTTKRSGTGLGLAVAQQVVTRNGGSIHVESAPGAGTTFSIAIPLAEASQGSTEVAAQRASLSVTRILLVEDEPIVAAGIVALLELEGIAVVVAERGAEAMPAAESFRPEAVILDLSLPDMPGTEVYERLAARWPNLPVIFSTGHGDEAALKPYLSAPHVGFLRKPYDFAALTAMLQKVSESVERNAPDAVVST